MAINLSDYEHGVAPEGDYEVQLRALQDRLERIQVAHIVHKRPAIIAVEGWDAAGKGGIIKALSGQLDPRWFEVFPIAAPTPDEKGRHFLYRFWDKLPAPGNWSVFDRTWYGRVLVERVEGFCAEREWKRAYDEINEFEAQQADAGNTIVKLFVHITQEKQDAEFAERLDDPWKHWKTNADDYRNRARRDDYLKAMDDMFKRTDTRWAPWTVIDGNHRKSGRIAALTAIADRLEANVSMEMPPLDPAFEAMARAALKGDRG